MLPVVLFILKLLGILVLILVGLVLGALLLVLFVPVRYRIEGSYYGRPKGKARITWLLHMVSVTAAFEDDFSVVIRLFGFRILKPVEESREDVDTVVQAMEVTGEDADRISGQAIRDAEESGKERIEENGTPAKEIQKEEFRKDTGPKAFLKKLKFSFNRLCDKLRKIKEKKDELQAWISNKDNQRTVRLLIRQIKKLLRHLLPKKGKGEVVFGFDDPYTTGQVLTAAAVIYPFCHDKLHIYPVFDRQVFTAEGHFKGRIRIGTLLFLAGRMLLDKNFRILLKRWLR